jgi:glycosyltransferase involved in cell wall biosynthesis
MRIALVAHHGSPLTPATGQDSFPPAGVAAHARALAKLGHRVTIYARRDSRGLPGSAILAPRVTVEHVPAGPPAPLAPGELADHVGAFGDYLAQRWHRNPPSVAHAYFWTSGLATLAAVRGLDVPLVQTFGTLGVALCSPRPHHSAPCSPRPHHPAQGRDGSADQGQEGRIRLEACIARRARAVLASTAAEAAELARMGVPRASVKVVPCGVDTGEFTPEGPVAKRNGRPRLLAVTSWDGAAGSEPAEPGRHGLGVLVRVLARVPDAELVIAGGPARAQLSKGRVYQDLISLAECFGVADRLAFTGRVAPGDLPALLRSADLLVSAAPSDPLGAVAIAAMACGTPVAACSAGGLRDAVLDGTTGVLVPPGRPDLLGRRVRLLLASPLRLEAFGIAAADRARARYSWDRISRETLAAYERCLRPAGPDLAWATS